MPFAIAGHVPAAATAVRLCFGVGTPLAWRAVMSHLFQDLRNGARLLARSPGFTLIAVLSLGIGIGANTATFSFADGLLLRPLPVRDADEVVTVGSINVATGGHRCAPHGGDCARACQCIAAR